MATPPTTIKLPAPDPEFRLTPDERASVRPGFDVDALERLLAAVEPEARPILLRSFQAADPAEGVPLVLRVGDDPELQPLLDEVWAPFWEVRPKWAFREDVDVPWPGRELARKRLEARGYRRES
jgi:hypothetical protein